MSNIRKVPFFDYPRLFTDDRENILQIIKNVCERGAFILQNDLLEFEKSLAIYSGSKYAVGVANATDGLELACLAIGLLPGDEVICSAHTMLATAASIKTAGGIPVPVDIGPDWLIDPEAVEAAIGPRTVGIMPTQLNGRTCNMDRLLQIANKNNLFVVEDAAQALGSKFRGRHAGTFGKAGSISFYPAKLLGCFGDGGGVITNDNCLFDKIFQLHDHGRDSEGEVRGWGRNSRLDNLQAAILNYKFKNYQDVIDRRRKIAAIYHDLLSHFEEIKLPPGPDANSDHYDVYQNYEIQAERRDELKKYLQQRGVGTIIQWGGKAVHQWEKLGFTLSLPVVESFFEKCIMLPLNVFISDDDVYYVCDTIKSFYRS